MTRSPRELATQKIQLRKQQEKLLSDFLTVVDDLDRAAEHWQKAEHRQASESSKSTAHAATHPAWWQRWRQWFGATSASISSVSNQTETLSDVVTSARAGIEMIRTSMLEILNEHQVSPMPVQGMPFDPTLMHALGQQADASVAPNTVVQEVVRGYLWKDRTLREAQVIVAVTPAESHSSESSSSQAP